MVGTPATPQARRRPIIVQNKGKKNVWTGRSPCLHAGQSTISRRMRRKENTKHSENTPDSNYVMRRVYLSFPVLTTWPDAGSLTATTESCNNRPAFVRSGPGIKGSRLVEEFKDRLKKTLSVGKMSFKRFEELKTRACKVRHKRSINVGVQQHCGIWPQLLCVKVHTHTQICCRASCMSHKHLKKMSVRGVVGVRKGPCVNALNVSACVCVCVRPDHNVCFQY